jgi:hypothetical protein
MNGTPRTSHLLRYLAPHCGLHHRDGSSPVCWLYPSGSCPPSTSRRSPRLLCGDPQSIIELLAVFPRWSWVSSAWSSSPPGSRTFDSPPAQHRERLVILAVMAVPPYRVSRRCPVRRSQGIQGGVLRPGGDHFETIVKVTTPRPCRDLHRGHSRHVPGHWRDHGGPHGRRRRRRHPRRPL